MPEQALRQLAALVGEPLDIPGLSGDEHARFALYKRALATASGASERATLETICLDPDAVMAEATIVAHIDRNAGGGATSESLKEWLLSMGDILEQFPFAVNRAREWIIFLRVAEDDSVDATDFLDATDWLQRKMADDVNSRPVLGVLAEHGRTRRVRAAAAQRLRELEKP